MLLCAEGLAGHHDYACFAQALSRRRVRRGGAGWLAPGAASANELAGKILREAGVVMVPGEAFGTKQHFRLSYATSLSNLEEGLKRLKRFFAEQGN